MDASEAQAMASIYGQHEHDWQVPPTERRYDGRPLAEFEDPMLLARERVRIRFGGSLPRDVSLALNEAYRRGRKEARAAVVAELRRQATHVPTTDDAEITWMRAFRNLADSIEKNDAWPPAVSDGS